MNIVNITWLNANIYFHFFYFAYENKNTIKSPLGYKIIFEKQKRIFIKMDAEKIIMKKIMQNCAEPNEL